MNTTFIDSWSIKKEIRPGKQHAHLNDETDATLVSSSQGFPLVWISPLSPASGAGLAPLPFSHLCAGGQIPLAKSNGAGNWSGRETISKVRSAGAGEQWLCDIPSRAQCATHNWKAFVIWLPFDYDVQDVNTNTTGVEMAREHARSSQFPGFTSQFRSVCMAGHQRTISNFSLVNN